jgi:hypothetical protein
MPKKLVISNAITENTRAALNSYKRENEDIAAVNRQFGWPTVTVESSEADIKQMDKNLDEMKRMTRYKLARSNGKIGVKHHSAKDGSFISKRRSL